MIGKNGSYHSLRSFRELTGVRLPYGRPELTDITHASDNSR